MESFAYFMSNIPRQYLPQVEQAINRAVEVLADPNTPEWSRQEVEEGLADIQQKVGTDSLRALEGEIKERLKAQWLQAGRAGVDFERQVVPKISSIVNRAESIRQSVAVPWFKTIWAKAGLAAAAIGMLVVAIVAGNDQGSGAKQWGGSIEAQWNHGVQVDQFERDLEESRRMSTRLAMDDYAQYQHLIDEVARPAVALRPEAIALLPPPVATVAARPVTVTVEEVGKSKQQYQQYLGNVYSALPSRSQRQVEASLSHFPDRSFTVESPVGSSFTHIHGSF